MKRRNSSSESRQQLTFRDITVNDGVFNLTFGGDYWQIYGLEIIEQSLLNTVTVTEVVEDSAGAMVPHLLGAFAVDLDANRTTVDTINGTVASTTAGYVTVATTLGTITTADALPNVPGIQVAVTEGGAVDTFTFDIRRPGGAGTPTISVQTIDGLGSLPPGTGSGIIDYVTQTLGAAGLLFDFDSDDLQTETGYTSVSPRQAYDITNGYGWTGDNADRDLHGSSDPGMVTHADLLRDSQGYVSARTFRADVTNGAYAVTATFSAGADISITNANGGGTLASGLDASGGTITHTFTYNATGNNGVQLTFGSNAPLPLLWKLNALTIRALGSVSGIRVTRPGGTLASDGASTSSWMVSGLTDGEVYTITPTAGTLGTVTLGGGGMSADFHSAYSGVQIVADASGTATFTLVAPAVPGNVTVTVNDVTGAATGTSASQNYDAPSPWLFDFEGLGGTTITSAAAVGMPTVTSVNDHTTFGGDLGYGWSMTFGRGDYDAGAGAPTAFRRDGVYFTGETTFQVAAEAGNYDVRIYTGNQNAGIPFDVTIEGVTTTITPTAGSYESFLLTNNGGVGAGGPGFTVADGVLDIQLTANTTVLFVNGLDVGSAGDLDGTNQQTLNAVAVGSGANALTQSQLEAAVAGALDRIAAGGASQATLDTLAGVTVSIADLSGTHLGITSEAANTIQIDLDAAGHGWFLDDAEFSLAISETELKATASSPAATSIDLLTTLLHEFAHILGFGHDDDGLLSESLETGTRHTDVDDVISDEALFNNLD